MEHKNFGATSLGASPSVRAGEWSAGWRTLLGGFLAMSTAWNVVSISLSVFLKPMQATFGWSRTELSIAPLASLLTAFLFPVTGLLLDRFGARKVAIAGTAAMGGALALFAVVPLNPTIFAALIVLLALAGAAINSFVLSRGVASIFQKNLGSALGILLSGVSVALAVLVPAISSRVAMYGWQAGFAALSALALLFSLPVLVLLFREPKHTTIGDTAITHRGRDTFAVLFAQLSFWRLAGACFIASIPIGGAINHLVPLLSDRGLSGGNVASLASVFAIAIGVGGLVNGALFDRLHAPLVTAVTLALSAIGSGLLYALPARPDTLGGLALAVALIGLATGTEGDYITYFSNRLFGLRNFARVVSVMALTISVGMALGGLFFSAIYDHWGNYGPAVIASIGLYIAAAVTFLSISMPPRASQNSPLNPLSGTESGV
ncbi:MFS transporter [Paraburkholderia sediminicola]|uniref:MFS transporter n=1 Tax=Paraburkholderia sediminicola TaxID=458836 RepID=UPI0038B9E76E